MKRATALIAAAALLGTSALAQAGDTKIGILMDITGPIANFIPPLQNAVNLAVKQVNAGGGLLDGNAVAVFGDTTGSAQGSVDAAGKLANIENVPVRPLDRATVNPSPFSPNKSQITKTSADIASMTSAACIRRWITKPSMGVAECGRIDSR